MKNLISIFISLIWVVTLSAQIPELPKYVIASGGDVVEASDIAAGITIGQTFIGPTAVSEVFAGFGFWYSVSDYFTGIEVVSKPSAPSAILYQNYPNPFWEYTTIEFSIPEKSHVILYVSDIFGKLVKNLADEPLQGGTYKITFEGFDLVSGNYFCTLSINGKLLTRKMSVVSY